MKKKRLLVLADLHCGHMVGLTPPHWHISRGRSEETNLPTHIANTQRVMWNTYVAEVRKLGKVDFLIVNGDAVDGKGTKSGGTELITSDMDEQSHMAIQCINQVDTSVIRMSYGTPYHTGLTEDWENHVAGALDAKIGSHDWLDIFGVIFDYKHFIGASSIPHGRHTAIARARMWNVLWDERDEQPKANVLVRSHVHYYIGASADGWEGVTTPSLQAAGTKFGARRCEGTVDLGFIYYDIWEDGSWTRNHVKFARAARKAHAEKLA